MKRLRDAVQQAFARRKYPGDERIADSDPRYESYEGHAIAAFHQGKDWREITLRHLFDEYPGDPTACLAFMTPEGWRYYLPAYVSCGGRSRNACGRAAGFAHQPRK